MAIINNINELDERIVFQEKRFIKDENGDMTESVVEVGKCWCHVKKQLLKEIKANWGTVLHDTVTFIIRSYQMFEIEHTMTIQYDGKHYEIIQSAPDATSKEYQLIIAKRID
ncbi:phage head closure protein [Enterococcus sp. LJL98]